MIVRWAIRAMLAALAPVVVLAGLDRASYQRPELAPFVPAPFRSFAQVPATALVLATADGPSAVAEARRLVRRRPMPAEHLFALALARLRANEPRAFAAAFRSASTRGWRFAPLQVASAQATLGNRDAVGAARRIAALWAAAGNDPALPGLTRALLDLPGGPQAFGHAMAGSRVWRNHFLARAGEVTSADRARATAEEAQRAGATFDCATLERFRNWLARQGAPPAPGSLSCS